MESITTIGLDIAKNVFQVHGVDAVGAVVMRRTLRRGKVLAFFEGLAPCLVGIEACGSAHHWARELSRLGHEVRLMPPSYVKPYVRRSKSDAADAAAICEAVSRPSMRFVPAKTVDQQTVLMLHRARDLLMRQRTATVNALRAHLAELGHAAVLGSKGVGALIGLVRAPEATSGLPRLARAALRPLVDMLETLTTEIAALERQILAWHRTSAESRRLAAIPSIGVLGATAIAATVGDARQFTSGRQLAAWLGLVPRQNSSGGHERLGRITKMGDRYIRTLLVLGATSLLRTARRRTDARSGWINALLARRPARLVAVAIANKTARIAFAVLARGEPYRANGPLAAV